MHWRISGEMASRSRSSSSIDTTLGAQPPRPRDCERMFTPRSSAAHSAATLDIGGLVRVCPASRRRRCVSHHQDFLRNAGHELRTPVSAISSAIEALQRGAKEDPAQRDRFLGHIEDATTRLERLLDALLVLARAQSGEEEPAVSRVPVEPVLRQVFEGVTPHVGVALETEVEAGLTVETQPR